ncbi:hypothetical protein BgiBS90_006664 [Biomphalaria glabrata]|nr:hypothetical protein BgiBS90_006664 [Biomphalaria glabrata]
MSRVKTAAPKRALCQHGVSQIRALRQLFYRHSHSSPHAFALLKILLACLTKRPEFKSSPAPNMQNEDPELRTADPPHPSP